MSESTGTNSPASPPPKSWRMDGVLGNAVFCALAASILILPQLTGQASAFAVIGILMVLGLLALIDSDRSVKAGLTNPLAMHAASLLLGVLAGALAGLPKRPSIPWMMTPVLLGIQMQVYFLLLGLSLPIKGRDQLSGRVSTLFCLEAYILACPHPLILPHLIIPVDINAAVIFTAGMFGGITAGMGDERDAITMSRVYPIAWGAASTLLIFCWWLVAARQTLH